jgi:hypothetical protein
MLPETRHLNNYDRNMVETGFIATAVQLVQAGTPLSTELKDDLAQLEVRLQTEVVRKVVFFYPRNTHPVTSQNLGKIAALRAQGAFSELPENPTSHP